VKYHIDKNDSYEGAWHVEGMSHENIIATSVCVVSQSDNIDAKIEFKKPINPEYFQSIENELSEKLHNNKHNVQYFLDYIEEGFVPVGHVPMKERSCVVFNNKYVHKVKIKNTSKTKKGERTIVVFWLVHPNKKIVSTSTIPPQQNKWTWENAINHRLELMKERTYVKQTLNKRKLNLCEH
jgi:hypothetical protein